MAVLAGVRYEGAAGLAALYTDNGQVMPPNGDFVTGRQAVQAFWHAVMDMGIKEAQLEIIEVGSHGDTAIICPGAGRRRGSGSLVSGALARGGGQTQAGALAIRSEKRSDSALRPICVCPMKLTDQGINDINDTPQRIGDGIKGVEAMGGKVTSFDLTMGDYDYVPIAEFPKNDVAATCDLGAGHERKSEKRRRRT